MTKALAVPMSKLQAMSTKKLFFVLLTALILMFASYVYLVNKTIMNVVARERTEKTLSKLSTTIGGLEFKYITLKNNITLELAHAKGFQDSTNTTFLAKNASNVSLSYNSTR